jgi:hypothetical protein
MGRAATLRLVGSRAVWTSGYCLERSWQRSLGRELRDQAGWRWIIAVGVTGAYAGVLMARAGRWRIGVLPKVGFANGAKSTSPKCQERPLPRAFCCSAGAARARNRRPYLGFERRAPCRGDFAVDLAGRRAEVAADLVGRAGFAADLIGRAHSAGDLLGADRRSFSGLGAGSSWTGTSGRAGPACRMRSSPARAINAPAPAYAPVTPSAAAAAPGRRASKRINPAVPVPEASAARAAPPPTMATPGPACLALAASSRRATSTCSRAAATTCCEAACASWSSDSSLVCSTPGAGIAYGPSAPTTRPARMNPIMVGGYPAVRRPYRVQRGVVPAHAPLARRAPERPTSRLASRCDGRPRSVRETRSLVVGKRAVTKFSVHVPSLSVWALGGVLAGVNGGSRRL